MSDKEFEELFEQAPDWATAVANLRVITAKTEKADDALALLKDSPGETILALMACHLVEVGGGGMNRWTGGVLKFEAPPWHIFVLKKAFRCLRDEKVSGEAREEREERLLAQEAYDAANERLSRSLAPFPPEMRRR